MKSECRTCLPAGRSNGKPEPKRNVRLTPISGMATVTASPMLVPQASYAALEAVIGNYADAPRQC